MDPIQPSGPLGALTLSTVNARTSIPQIRAGERTFWTLSEAPTIAVTDKGQIAKFPFTLAQPTVDSTGQPLLPGGFGSKYFLSVFMYAGEGKDPTHFLPTLAGIVDALLGTVGEGDSNPKGKPIRPEIIAPGSTIGNVTFDGNVISALLGKTLSVKMVADKRADHQGEVQFARNLEHPGDVKA